MYMKIENILKLIEEDKKIDHTQLDTESLKIPEQAVKYQQMAHEKEPFDHKVLKSDVNIFLESDKQLNELQDRISTQSEKLKLVVHAGQTMQNKSFNIKNALEHQKFMGGAF